MTKSIFKPYVGPNYSNSDFKLLVLGESHYAPQFLTQNLTQNQIIERFEFTNDIVKKHISYKQIKYPFERWMNTFTKFANVYLGRTLSKIEQVNFWESVSFYNFIQTPMANNRTSPSHDDFRNSYDAFKQVCHSLNPDFILFWGNRLWNNFPRNDYQLTTHGDLRKQNFLSLDRMIPFLVTPHPSSSYFNYNNIESIAEHVTMAKDFKANKQNPAQAR